MRVHLGMFTGGLFVATAGIQLVANGTSTPSIKIGIVLFVGGAALTYFSFGEHRNFYRLGRQIRSLKQDLFGS